MGQKMNFIGEKIRISDNGFRQVNRLYHAQDCNGCPVDVEAVFGIIKGNKNYRKFLLRGLEKVEIEVGLLALSHNLSKIAARN